MTRVADGSPAVMHQFGTVTVVLQRFSTGAVHVRLTDTQGGRGGWTMHDPAEARAFLAEVCRLTLGQQHGRFEF